MKTAALIFDMDGTMIDSMPFHRDSWIDFAALHGIGMGVDEMMRRTTGRNGAECMSELFGRAIAHDEAWTLVRQKEALYRQAFAPPAFREVAGFRAFASQARSLGWLARVAQSPAARPSGGGCSLRKGARVNRPDRGGEDGARPSQRAWRRRCET